METLLVLCALLACVLILGSGLIVLFVLVSLALEWILGGNDV